MPMYDEIPVFRYRLIDYVGDGFLLGAGGGTAYHFIRGLRNSPSGGRLAGGVRAVGTSMPRVAGSCGAYIAVFCAAESAMSHARRREDHWNSIAAGAAAAGLLSMRRGAAAAARSSLLGATLLVGVAGFYWATDFVCSSLTSWRESQMDRVLPAPAAITPQEGEKGQITARDQVFLLYGGTV